MQEHFGSGSKSSPIFISDDEDEMEDVSTQLLSTSYSTSSSTSTASPPLFPPRKQGSTTTLQPTERRNQISGKEVSKKRKRKHEQNIAAHTKNKRVRQQERAGRWQKDQDAPHQTFDDAVFESETSSSQFSTPADMFLPEMDNPPLSAETSSFSSSWANSMAQAADPSEFMQNLFPAPFEFIAPTPNWTPQSFMADLNQTTHWSVPSTSTTLPEKPAQVSLPLSSSSRRAELPQKPSSTNTIGMSPSRDPHGKRGGFKLTAATVFESKPSITYPYTPDSSRSIILDQLPKLCRAPSWLKNWSLNACGTHPSFLAVDSSTAKALLEFPSDTCAKKAWSSPKLGKELSTMSSSQLKGKSREDLIRVWWYRAPSQPLVFDRKELEEGEIEDDNVQVEGKKESKKERRARLSKEDIEKQKKETVQPSKKANDQTLLTSPSASSESSSTALPIHGQSLHPTVQPTALPSTAWPLPTSTFSARALPSLSQYHTSIDPASLLSGVWHNGFTGPISAHHLSTPPTGAANNGSLLDDHRDDVDMDLSSPTAPLSVSPSMAFQSPVIERKSSLPPANSEGIAPLPSTQPSALPTLTPTPFVSSLTRSESLSAGASLASDKPVPQGPSFTQRSLLARRQKELEERIARSKLELERREALVGRKSTATIQSTAEQPVPTPLQSSPVLTSSSPSTLEPVAEPPSDKQAMEDHLRSLVLASQRRKQKSSAPATLPTRSADPNDELEEAVISQPLTPDASSRAHTPPASVNSGLDELAVSFIQESIQTMKPIPSPPPPPVSQPILAKPPSNNNSSVELAARREQLEFQIAETKRLMGLLSKATSKQERDSIMTQIHELSRATDPGLSLPARSNSTTVSSISSIPSYPSFLVKPIEPVRSLWPESIPSGGIFIISDDEDDEEEDYE